MSAVILRPAAVTPADRLGLTLCVAIIVHAMVVLGVSFAPETPSRPRSEALEVTLVARQSEKPPERPDLLAQANLRGGGDQETRARPSAPLPAPLPAPESRLTVAAAPAPSAPRTPPFEPAPAPPAPQPAHVAAAVADEPAAAEQAAKPAPAPVVARRAERAEVAAEKPPTRAPEQPDAMAAAPAAASEPAPPTEPALPTAAQLLTRSFALASLNADLQQKLESRAHRPRRKYISASTQEYRYAAYMEAWRAKVERIGNLNYPDEARQRRLSGNLLLDVALKPDGSVIEILVRRPSGHKVLDDAAVRIVELAAPFAQFPPEIAAEVDILHVTRTWKFLNTDRFAAQ